jgi:peroxiredoxin
LVPFVSRRPLRKRLLLALAAVAAVAGLYLLVRHNAGSASPGVNSAERPLAPDFLLPRLDGQRLALASYKGKVVLLDFWATWCAPCRQEIPQFVKLQDKYRDRGLQIIGISMDDEPEPVRDFSQGFKMNYPVVMGNAKTGELYGGVLGLPTAFLIGRDGRIAFKHVGPADLPDLEKEIVDLLQQGPHSSLSEPEISLLSAALPVAVPANSQAGAKAALLPDAGSFAFSAHRLHLP